MTDDTRALRERVRGLLDNALPGHLTIERGIPEAPGDAVVAIDAASVSALCDALERTEAERDALAARMHEVADDLDDLTYRQGLMRQYVRAVQRETARLRQATVPEPPKGERT